MNNRKIFILILGLVSFQLSAQVEWKSDKKVLKKHFSKHPSGNLWAGKTEVSNAEYKQFLKESKAKDAEIDTAAWNQLVFGEAFANLYHRDAAFDTYPVVNIRFEDAQAYCEWFQTELNKIAQAEQYVVRLPSDEEWESFAKGGQENYIFPWEGYSLRNQKGQFRANFTYIPQSWIKREGEEFEVVKISSTETSQMRTWILAPVRSYAENPIGLYNMAGNVAEMTDIKGKTKGGSWKDTGYYMLINAPDPYRGIEEASPYIGFRIVVEKKKT